MTTVACSRSMRVVVLCHSVITATVNYTLTESLDDNCSVQSVNACRSLVSHCYYSDSELHVDGVIG